MQTVYIRRVERMGGELRNFDKMADVTIAVTAHSQHLIVLTRGVSDFRAQISRDGSKWVSCRPRFLFPEQVLSQLFRRLFLQKLVAAHQAGELQFFGNHTSLTERKAFTAFLAPLRNIKWYVYCKRPFRGPKQVLRYLARYTHRVAISNRRLIAADETGVTLNTRTTGSKDLPATRP